MESFSSRETPEGRQMTAKASASMNDEWGAIARIGASSDLLSLPFTFTQWKPMQNSIALPTPRKGFLNILRIPDNGCGTSSFFMHAVVSVERKLASNKSRDRQRSLIGKRVKLNTATFSLSQIVSWSRCVNGLWTSGWMNDLALKRTLLLGNSDILNLKFQPLRLLAIIVNECTFFCYDYFHEWQQLSKYW